jgi:hypothetical protein
MKPAAPGTRIRVVRNHNNHTYTIGDVYTVSSIDDDGTFRAADDKGRIGNWLRWSECEPAGVSTWSKIAADLPEPLMRFLCCFDGIGEITLKEKVVDAVLAKLPDLHERIVTLASTPVGDAATSSNRPQKPQQNQ